MQISDIPTDSILRHWCRYLLSTEVPFSYQLAGGLSTIGAILKRNRWVDQLEWRVYPNQSVMFIGPSGIGKDTIINRVQRSITAVEYLSRVPTIGGVTLENIKARLADLPKPAAAFMAAGEMTAFFGKADYQQNMLTGITDLLSNNDKIDITTKGEYKWKGEKFIYEPTITLHTGSTIEWLHGAMPTGTMEGGFLGRFLIVCEELGGRHIPLVKRDKTHQELATLKDHLSAWTDGLESIIRGCSKPREVIIYTDGEDAYANWYYNRFKLFSKAVTPYANRSRDTVLRLAMLMAFSRGHYRWIEEVDINFAIQFIAQVAERIDRVVLPPSVEAAVAQKILDILPARMTEIYNLLGMRYRSQILEEGLNLLRKTDKIKQDKEGVFRLVRKD